MHFLNCHFRLPKGLQRTGYKHFFTTDLTAIQRQEEFITPEEGQQYVSQEWTDVIKTTPVEVNYGSGKAAKTMSVFPALKVEKGCGMLQINHALAQVFFV